MHSSIKIGECSPSDGRNTGNPNFQGFALAISVNDEAEFDKIFKRPQHWWQSHYAAEENVLLAPVRHTHR